MFPPRPLILDCGASRTALGVFSRAGRRMRLDHCAVETFAASAGSGDDWLEQTRSSLRALRARVRLTGPAVLVLPAHLVLTRFIKVPRVGPEQREKIIRFEAGENIPYALTDVVWDTLLHLGPGHRRLDLRYRRRRRTPADPRSHTQQNAAPHVRRQRQSRLAPQCRHRCCAQSEFAAG